MNERMRSNSNRNQAAKGLSVMIDDVARTRKWISFPSRELTSDPAGE